MAFHSGAKQGTAAKLNAAAKETARQLDIEQIQELGNNEKFNCLYGAPTLVIVSGDANAPMPLDADCAAATENMLIAAESIGVGSCWIFFTLLAFASEQGEQLKKELKIPDGYKLFSSIALGYKQNGAAIAPERKPDLITFIR